MATKKTTDTEVKDLKETTAAEEPKKKAVKKAKVEKPETEEAVEVTVDELPDANEEAKAEPAAETAQDVDAMIARNTSRFAHELAKASKREKKEMYRSEHVITEWGDEDISTDATQLREDYLELVGSATSGKILEGKITGFRYAGETRRSTILAEVEFGSGMFAVLIPSYLLYDYDVSKYIEPDMIRTIENNMIRRIGSTIKFMVRHVDEKARTAYADRLAAQSIIGVENYIRPTRDGRPRIFKGLVVKSQVIYTTSKGIIVDALGADIAIKREDLSHSYVGDARAEFKVGDFVNVRISKVSEIQVEKNDTTYRLVVAEGSVKDASVNKKALLFDQFSVDGIYAAEVTYIEEAGVFCRLKGNVDCLCALPRFGANPQRGQQRLVKITQKDEDKLFLFGIFVNN